MLSCKKNTISKLNKTELTQKSIFMKVCTVSNSPKTIFIKRFKIQRKAMIGLSYFKEEDFN
jgi:hypothetical protein